jgi:hypothetical protein
MNCIIDIEYESLITTIFVPTEMVHKVYDACKTEKELLIIDDATHAASLAKDPYTYMHDFFLNQYL